MRKFYIYAAQVLAAVLLFTGCSGRAPVSGPESTSVYGAVETGTEAETPSAGVSAVSETAVLQTTVPQTTAPQTTAPQTAAPQTTAPQTAAPQTVMTNGGTELPLSSLAHCTDADAAPAVYFTKEISADALLDIYRALPYGLGGRVAVKLSTGESEATNYLRPALIEKLVKTLDASIVECMTAYGGVRSTALLHKQVAKDRGYTDIAAFDLMDEDGNLTIPYGGTRIDRAIVGSHIENYDGFLVLSHFKGHLMAGFGGAIKNVGIGMSGRSGKIYVHSGGTRTVGTILTDDQDAFLEALAEAVKAISDYEDNGRNMLYISVMNRLSVDCDCMALPVEPDMHDIGILASTDPVALDQACVDFVYAVPDGQSLIARMESLHGVHVLEHADAIGLGSRSYRLIDIDG
ncbi:MAG: DUF362 domain-containing protein [Clostridia bacterium]|nr:DUF362 domain-containing protein [Clostridia bacterium]